MEIIVISEKEKDEVEGFEYIPIGKSTVFENTFDGTKAKRILLYKKWMENEMKGGVVLDELHKISALSDSVNIALVCCPHHEDKRGFCHGDIVRLYLNKLIQEKTSEALKQEENSNFLVDSIKAKTCIICGKPIPIERLKAIPHTQ